MLFSKGLATNVKGVGEMMWQPQCGLKNFVQCKKHASFEY